MDRFDLRRVFVSPHAMRRFRERIRRSLSDAEIIAVIQSGCANPHSLKLRTLPDGTPSVTVRVKRQVVDGVAYHYRCVVVPPEMPGGWPVVGTVLHGTTGYSRGRNQRPREQSVDA